jgi:uncharacterized membrane protein YesL
MAGLFNAENKLWSGINSAVDAILLNFMWLITCIPIITIGVSTTAFYYTTHKVIRNQRSGIWTEYWSSFKSNFKQATKTWLIFLVLFVIFYCDITICTQYLQAGEQIGVLAWFFIVLTALTMVWFMYVFAYMARFENDLKTTLKNGAVMLFTNPLSSVQILVIMCAALLACWWFLPLILFVPCMAIYLVNMVLEKVFRKYMTPEELAEEEENDRMRKR